MVDLDVLVITRTVFCDLIFVGLPGIPEPGQEFYSQGFALCPGGLSANSGMALSRLGMKVGVISRIGRVPLGDVLYRQLEAEGVDLTHVLLLDEEPTAVSVAMSLPADRCFVTYPPRSRAEEPLPIDFEFVRLARHVLVSATDITRHQLERIREMGVGVTLDTGWDATGEAQTVFDLLPLVDIFVPNEVEACRLTGASDVRD
ncbi:MAG: carbohydrate kinase family protein, partial [Bacillota bacterium]